MPNWRGLSLVFICALLGRGAVGEDLLVLQRQWQPTACSEGGNCAPDYKDSFAIQRLYQASDANAAPQTGCTGGGGLRRADVDASALDETELECAYYNATAGLTSQLIAWRDVWNAYGRCTAAGDAITYLALGLDLDLAYPLPVDLPARVNGSALAAAIKAAFGTTPQLTCQGGKLAAVSLCFPADAFTAEGTAQPVDCPWPTEAACSGALQVPRGTQGMGADCAAYVQQSPVDLKGLAAAAPAPSPAAPAPAPVPAKQAAAARGSATAQAPAASSPASSPAIAPESATAGQAAQQQGGQTATAGGSSGGGGADAASSAQLSGSASNATAGSSGGSGSDTSTGAMVGALVGGVAAGIVAGMAAFGGGYYWWSRRRRTAPAAASPAKPSGDDLEKGLASSSKGPRGSSTPSSDTWSDAGSGSGAKRAESRSSAGASLPPSPCLPRRSGSAHPSPPRPASSGSGGSGSSPPGSTGGYTRSPSAPARGSPGLRAYPLAGVATGGQQGGRTSVDNPLWAPPASPGGMSSRSLVGGWTATDNPLSADGSEERGSSGGQGPLLGSISNASSGSSRRLARAEGASGSGSLQTFAEGSAANGRPLLRTGSAPGGPLVRTTSGMSQPRTPYSPAANRSLPRTPSGASVGSARQLAHSRGSMGSGEFVPERSGPSAGGGSLAGSGSKFAQRPPAHGMHVGPPIKAVKYAQPAGRTPASATTKSFNARTAPPKEAPQRLPSKLDRLLSQGSGQAAQTSAAESTASGSAGSS